MLHQLQTTWFTAQQMFQFFSLTAGKTCFNRTENESQSPENDLRGRSGKDAVRGKADVGDELHEEAERLH